MTGTRTTHARNGSPGEPLPRRPYGRSGIPLSVIGFGGIVVMNAEPDAAARAVAAAVDRGVNYFDVAPSYGNAEERLGPALEPHRKSCFLACKTTKRDAAGGAAELRASLARMRTDYFDLYQLHALTDVVSDVDAAFSRGGVMETLIEAKRTGQVRHLGFSAHSVEAALAALNRFAFDSVLLPVNFATFHQGNFGPTVLAEAARQGVSVLALKAMARQRWPQGDPGRAQHPKCWYQPVTEPREQELAVRFTLSQPVVAAIPPGDEALFWRAVEIAATFTPLSAAEAAEVKAMADQLEPVFRA